MPTQCEDPNVVLILVDDMGYSDIGCYGGEIETPNLDALARDGLRFSQFYNTARCCPSRASLLTGLHPHQTGIGHMTNDPVGLNNDLGAFGYRGFLNRNCVTLAEVLKEAGYSTCLSGKWHLGYHGEEKWPLQRGFEKFYGIISGACNYFRPEGETCIVQGNTPVEIKDDSFYATDEFTDFGIRFIEEQGDDDPFFLYLAYNAPHWPLQAKEEDVEKYRDRYLCGWDELRKERYRRLQEMGLISPGCSLSPRDPEVRAWDDVDEVQKAEMAYRMAVYAAQVDSIDQNIGRLIDCLKQSGKLDNTLLIFMSDNGACAEGGEFGAGDRDHVNCREIPKLMISVGQAWANASNTPFRKYKHYVHEGGISTPLIVHWPQKISERQGTINHSPAYLIDIMPTILEATGASYPESYFGNTIFPLEGSSMVPLYETGEWQEHEYMFWEHESNCTLRMGDYKIIQRYDTKEWRLYNLKEDRSELTDLSEQMPDRLRMMMGKWYELAEGYFAIPKPESYKY
jgi:arylsulfatase A-like enzyme